MCARVPTDPNYSMLNTQGEVRFLLLCKLQPKLVMLCDALLQWQHARYHPEWYSAALANVRGWLHSVTADPDALGVYVRRTAAAIRDIHPCTIPAVTMHEQTKAKVQGVNAPAEPEPCNDTIDISDLVGFSKDDVMFCAAAMKVPMSVQTDDPVEAWGLDDDLRGSL